MTTDPTAPATKQDITLLMREIGRLYDANERWKQEILLHFDTAVEQFRHDLRSINIEKIQDHDNRIVRLELHTGLRRAA